MGDVGEVIGQDRAEVLLLLPEGCVVETRGVVMAVWVASPLGETLRALHDVLLDVGARNPAGVASLTVFRPARGFPLPADFPQHIEEVGRMVRTIKRHLVANAYVLEYQDMVGDLLVAGLRALDVITGPSKPHFISTSLVEAADWLRPRIVAPGGPAPLAHYLGTARAMLRTHEAFARG